MSQVSDLVLREAGGRVLAGAALLQRRSLRVRQFHQTFLQKSSDQNVVRPKKKGCF